MRSRVAKKKDLKTGRESQQTANRVMCLPQTLETGTPSFFSEIGEVGCETPGIASDKEATRPKAVRESDIRIIHAILKNGDWVEKRDRIELKTSIDRGSQ